MRHRLEVKTMLKKPVMTDPVCHCGKFIVGTVKDGIRHGKDRCVPIGLRYLKEGKDEKVPFDCRTTRYASAR
jgi:hypothetical protein